MREEVDKGWWDRHIFDEFEQLIKSGAVNLLSRSAGASQ
jgi:hypothetical protein